jgi:hypothetical protein
MQNRIVIVRWGIAGLFSIGMLGAAIAGQSAILSHAEVRTINASAPTVAGHQRLAAHYRAHAREHSDDAMLHEQIVASARNKHAADDDAWELARNAAHYAEHSREAAEALNELATLHEEMAKRTR